MKDVNSNDYNGGLSIKGPNDALGISIAGGKGSPLGDIPIFIAMIQASGVAARTHKLKVRGKNSAISINTVFLVPLLFPKSEQNNSTARTVF